MPRLDEGRSGSDGCRFYKEWYWESDKKHTFCPYEVAILTLSTVVSIWNFPIQIKVDKIKYTMRIAYRSTNVK